MISLTGADDTPVNATNPDVMGTFIDPASQTPLWNLLDSEPYSIHVEGVWRVTNSTPEVVVAVIDTGIAEVAGSIFHHLLDGYDFISDDKISVDGDGRDSDATDPGDWGDQCPTPSWHGTKVASILAARHDNALGMKGVAQNCSVLPVRVLGLCRTGYATDVTDAIVWAAGGTINGIVTNPSPAEIISLSLAGQGACPSYLQSAVSQVRNLGATVMAAAGNNNQDAAGYFPANCEGVITVAASTRGGGMAGYSNWGTLISVTAPGGDTRNAILTLGVNQIENDMEAVYGMGTSFATPHVAGVAALFSSTDWNLDQGNNPSLFTQALLTFTERINCTFFSCGNGIIQASPISNTNRVLRQMIVNTSTGQNNTLDAQAATDTQIPDGNIPGFVLDTFREPLYWSTTERTSSQYLYQCGPGYFMCQIRIFYDGATKGFGFKCCNMNGDVTYNSAECLGPCGLSYIFRRIYGGYFKSVAMISNGFFVSSVWSDIPVGISPSLAVIQKAQCIPGWYVNGIYGDTGTAMSFNGVVCRPFFYACPTGYYSLGPQNDATGGALACGACGTYESRIQCSGANTGTCVTSSCAANFFWFNGGCSSCGAVGSVKQCAKDRYASCPAFSTSVTCLLCSGHALPYCDIGYEPSFACDGGSIEDSRCIVCPFGKEKLTSSIAWCTQCNTGYYKQASLVVANCQPCTNAPKGAVYSDWLSGDYRSTNTCPW